MTDLPARLLAALSPGHSPGRFLGRVMLFSLAVLLPVLALYVALIPGFAGHLWQGGPAAGRFLRQVLTNGLVTVSLMNVSGLLLMHHARHHPPMRRIAADILLRLALFIGLHGVVFWGSALLFGAFGGDPVQALRVVGPTLAQAGAFANLSGVYLYAGLVSALLWQAAVLGKARALALLAGQIIALATLTRLLS